MGFAVLSIDVSLNLVGIADLTIKLIDIALFPANLIDQANFKILKLMSDLLSILQIE